MDAYHYDKIADKLIQFHSKLPRWQELEHEMTKHHVRDTKILIESLLSHIDVMSKMDDKGWIR